MSWSAGCCSQWWGWLPSALRALWGSWVAVASLAFGCGPRASGNTRGSTEPSRWARNTSSWFSASGRNWLISCPWCKGDLWEEIKDEEKKNKTKMIFLLSERAQLLLMEDFICLLRKEPQQFIIVDIHWRSLLCSNVLIITVPNLTNNNVFEPSYNNLKFTVQNLCTSLISWPSFPHTWLD